MYKKIKLVKLGDSLKSSLFRYKLELLFFFSLFQDFPQNYSLFVALTCTFKGRLFDQNSLSFTLKAPHFHLFSFPSIFSARCIRLCVRTPTVSTLWLSSAFHSSQINVFFHLLFEINILRCQLVLCRNSSWLFILLHIFV